MNYNHELITFSDRHPIRLFINKIDSIEPHWHQSLEISVIIQGKVSVQVSDLRYEFQKGDCFLINGNEIHSLRGNQALLCTLQVRLDQLERLPFKEVPYFRHDFSKEKGKLIRNVFASLLKNNSATAEGPLSLLELSLVYRLLYFLYQEGISDVIKGKTQESLDRLTSILAYINSEYKNEISLKSVAENEFLSESYLSRYFKENVQMTFSEYLKNVRLSKAVEILLSGNLPIDQISARVGFPNPRAFVSAFRDKYGLNPSVYRKLHADDNTILTGNDTPDSYRSFNYLDDSFEEDRALVTKFIVHNSVAEPSLSEKSSALLSGEDIKTISLNAQDGKREENGKGYLTMIGGGRVKDIHSASHQEEIRTLQKEIGFRYIKLHSVFDDDLMVVTRQDSKLLFNFTFIDEAYDFLLSVGLKPLVQLSFLPGALADRNPRTIFLGKSIIGYPKDIEEWNLLLRTFLLHLIDRYGKKEIDTWLFGVWNEPASVNQLFGLRDEEYDSLYENSYRTLKGIDPELCFGGPASFSTYGKKDGWLYSFLEFTKRKGVIPDYVSIHYYDIDLSWIEDPKETEKNIPNRIYLSPDENSFSRFLLAMKGRLNAMGIHSPLYITEWNNTVSHKDLLSDTCFKSAYLVKNILETNNMVSSCSYWSISDYIDENVLPKELFHGGLGLFTYGGIKKPSYNAYLLLKRLGKDVLKSGDGYYITRGENAELRMIFYYYVPYNYEYSRQMDYQINMHSRDAFFRDREKKAFQLQLSGFEGEYEEMRMELSPESGSAFDFAKESGNASFEEMDLDYLKQGSFMKRRYEKKKMTGLDYLTYELSPPEVLYVELWKTEGGH